MVEMDTDWVVPGHVTTRPEELWLPQPSTLSPTTQEQMPWRLHEAAPSRRTRPTYNTLFQALLPLSDGGK